MASATHEEGCADEILFDHRTDWVTAYELTGLGVASEFVMRLPVRHIGHDGRPCWPADEVNELLSLAAQEGR